MFIFIKKISFLLLMTIFSFSAMEAPKRKIREMIALDRTKHTHQINCLIDAYICATLSLDNNNDVIFNDYNNDTIAYSVPHSQVMGLINSLKARKDEISDRNMEAAIKWAQNPYIALAQNQINILQEWRFIDFEFDILSTQENKEELEKAQMHRSLYRAAFAQKQKDMVEMFADKKLIHSDHFLSLPETVKRLNQRLLYDLMRK